MARTATITRPPIGLKPPAPKQRHYYVCIAGEGLGDVRKMGCDLGWLGPDQRKERWTKKGQPMCRHSVRVMPSRGEDARGRPLPPDYIVTDRPLAKQYLEVMEKKVSRPRFDPITGRRNGRVYRKKVTQPKFRELEPYEVDREVRERAIDRDWVEDLFTEASYKVDLPKDAAILDRTSQEDDGEEDVVPSDDEDVKTRGN